MGLFGKILNKLGIEQPKEQAASKKEPTVRRTSDQAAAERAERIKRIREMRAAEAKEIPMVDVMAKLEQMAEENPQDLNWRRSIVDLLKLLDIDSSYEARKELADELGCPEDKMDDSAEMNTWLHKTVLEKIAENGGNIPMELLD
jgi:hypothetical protein